MRVRVLPRDVAAGIITGAVASLGWAIGAATLVLAIPLLIETLARAGHASSLPLPLALLLLMLLCLGLVVWRGRPWSVIAYLIVGFVATVSYELYLLQLDPGLLDQQVYVINRPAVALVLVGLTAGRPLTGIAWAGLGFLVSNAATVTVTVISGEPFRPGYGPLLAFVVAVAAYVSLWGMQLSQRRRVPNIDELEAETARMARGEDLARRTTAAVHDTLLNDLSIVMNSPERLDVRTRERLRQDLETLRGADWLRTASQVAVIDDQDTSMRNEIMRLISGFQWRGLSVHVTGSGEGIYRLAPATERAFLDALAAALENVARHSQASVAEVELVYTPEAVTIMVTDEGVGFDPTAIADDRLGVRESIAGRIEAAGGTVQLWSAPGSGTSIVMTVPITSVVREHDAPHHQDRA